MDRSRIEKLKELIQGLEKSHGILMRGYEEADEATKKTIQQKLRYCKEQIKEYNNQIRLIEMNEYDSSSFEWEPHRGMNRQQARNFRKRMNKIEHERQRIKKEHDNNKRPSV